MKRPEELTEDELEQATVLEIYQDIRDSQETQRILDTAVILMPQGSKKLYHAAQNLAELGCSQDNDFGAALKQVAREIMTVLADAHDCTPGTEINRRG